MDDFRRANRARWDELVAVHVGSKFYDLDAFKRGRSSLDEIEIKGVGHVLGKSLLHLQCHFGLGSLSFARLGAEVMGVDFAPKAIELAEALAQEEDLTADFLCCDLYDLPYRLDRRFDTVFTSYGVLSWLEDLEKWGQIIARYLKPGGRFFMAEFHPFLFVFDDEPNTESLKVRYPYFAQPEPLRFVENESYASDGETTIENKVAYEWCHSFSDVLQALISAGLRIDEVREYDRCCYQALPTMVEVERGWWQLPKHMGSVPLMFSIKATLPEASEARR